MCSTQRDFNCELCEHFEKDCIWNHDYLDTDYAYDCIDFERNETYKEM